MYTLYVDSFFWTGHSVLLPDGSPESVHNHNFCATARLTADRLDGRAMVMDFCTLKESLDAITGEFTRAGNIGRIDYFAKNAQTAEIIAEYIFKKLEPALPKGVTLEEIIVTEEPNSRAGYTK